MSTPSTPSPSLLSKLTSNKPLALLGGLTALGGAWYLSRLCTGRGRAALPTPSPSSQFRFRHEDFGPLATRPLHLNLHFDIAHEASGGANATSPPDAVVTVTNETTFVHVGGGTTSAGDDDWLRVLELDARDLEVVSVERYDFATPVPVDGARGSGFDYAAHVRSFRSPVAQEWELDEEADKLRVRLAEPVAPGQQFVLRLVTTAKPTAHILEGMYYDYTPPEVLEQGAPRTIITQCQQWGFQRITPAIDRMRAKAFYTTTIVADERYTNMLSNGDPAPGFVNADTGEPEFQPQGDGRAKMCYHNWTTNMAPYLFFLGVGYYVTYRRQLVYPSGRSVVLELLTFPGLVKPEHARVAINALHDSVLWMHLHMGPEAYDHEAEAAEIEELIARRDEIHSHRVPMVIASDEPRPEYKPLSDEQNHELAEIEERLRQLISVWKQTGYTYTGAVYREISMQNSDFGGMENVGNTTILASRIAPSDHLSDAAYVYMESVKVHEFIHNLVGSTTTGTSPFTIWLNEAATVHFQRKREDVLFSHDWMRLRQVGYAFAPGRGPLARDRTATALAIEPDGFNKPTELITATTYSKAPEFVRNIELLLGKGLFMRGLALYFRRYKFANATTADWVACMEEVSGLDLKDMTTGWLRRTGYPDVTYSGTYDAAAKQYRLHVRQTGFENQPKVEDRYPWTIVLDCALVKDGAVTHEPESPFVLREAEGDFVFDNVDEEPDFCSFARDWSFFGTSSCTTATPEQMRLQALSDPDTINRYFAYRALADAEKARVVEALRSGDTATCRVSDEYVELHATILFDDSISPATRAMIVHESASLPSHPDLAHLYTELRLAACALHQAVYAAHADRVTALYEQLEAQNEPGPHLPQLQERQVKAHLFSLLMAASDEPVLGTTSIPAPAIPAARRAEQLLRSSTFMSDKLMAFRNFLEKEADESKRAAVLAEMKEAWRAHPDTIESYITTLASARHPSTLAAIRELIADDSLFDMAQSGHSRTLARAWIANREQAVLTQEGLDLTVELLVSIGKVNQMSATDLLTGFADLAKFEPAQQSRMRDALSAMRAGLDPVKEKSLYSQVERMLT